MLERHLSDPTICCEAGESRYDMVRVLLIDGA